MLFEATVNGRVRRVEVTNSGDGYRVTIDGRVLEVDLPVAATGGERGGAGEHPFLSLLVEGRSHEVGLEAVREAAGGPTRQGGAFRVHFPRGSVVVELAEAAARGGAPVRKASGPARVTAPMPGRVVRLLVAPGESVEAGQGLVVVEAMKMENELRAPRAGQVQQVAVREGQAVESGALLVVVA